MVDEEQMLQGGGAHQATEGEESESTAEVNFSKEVCESANIPVFLIRKANEEYDIYLKRITKFLKVRYSIQFLANFDRIATQIDSV